MLSPIPEKLEEVKVDCALEKKVMEIIPVISNIFLSILTLLCDCFCDFVSTLLRIKKNKVTSILL